MRTEAVTQHEKDRVLESGDLARIEEAEIPGMIQGLDLGKWGGKDPQPDVTMLCKKIDSLFNHLGSTEITNHTALILNEAKLNAIELARLWHWRLAHAAQDVPYKMGISEVANNEDCYCCDQSKFRTNSFKRNPEDRFEDFSPWWRTYCDG
jgi:hypothetical protein